MRDVEKKWEWVRKGEERGEGERGGEGVEYG